MGIRKAAFVGWLTAAPIALGQITFPPYHVEITKILHSSDPAPGIPGATVVDLGAQIDGAGKVLIDAYLSGPGITPDNNRVLWYGDQNGLAIVIRKGDPAPGVSGAFIDELWEAYVNETGLISLACYLSGPSIVPGVNARGAFVGTPGNLQKLVQAGEPAPFTEPGTVFASSSTAAIRLTDNGTVFVIYDLAGPAVNTTNDQAIYAWSPGPPQLIWRRGMAAPGTDPGVVFAWSEPCCAAFNDLGQFVSRCGLSGPGVTNQNDSGYWVLWSGGGQLVAREGFQGPQLPPGVNLFGTAFPGSNALGEVVFYATLSGPDVDSENNSAIWAGNALAPSLVMRTGDPAPDMMPGIVIASAYAAGVHPINSRGFVALYARLSGLGVNSGNDFATYLGPPGGMRLVMREGDSLPQLGAGINAGFGDAIYALNDVGDLVAVSFLTGANVTPENDKVCWVRRRGGWWAPLLRTGDVIDGRTVLAGSLYEFSPIKDCTGGSDAVLQRLNDNGEVVASPLFSDASRGVYVLHGSAAVDGDFDGDLDLQDYETLPACLAGPLFASGSPPCSYFDIDFDGDVDLRDLALFQEMFSGNEP